MKVMENIANPGFDFPHGVDAFQMDKGIPSLVPVRFHGVSCNSFVNGMEITVFLTPVHTGLPGGPCFFFQAGIFFLCCCAFLFGCIIGSFHVVDDGLRMAAAIGFLIIIGLPVGMFKVSVFIGCNGILADA